MKRLIINKRIKRQIKENIYKYAAIFFLIVFGMTFIISMVGAADSIFNTVSVFHRESKIEDGEFVLFMPLTTEELENARKNYGVIEENFFLTYDLVDGTSLRVFKNRDEINLINIEKGHLGEGDNQVVLEKHYAEKNEYNILDKIEIGGEDYIISGIGSVPDYNLVKKNISDVGSDTSMFSVAFLSEDSYDLLLASNKMTQSEEYCYSYVLSHEQTHGELKDYLKSLTVGADNLIIFKKSYNNSRINDYGEDALINKKSALFAGVFIILLIAYVLSVFTLHNIEQESRVIGALFSLGYKKRELMRHFMVIPIGISFSGGVVGTLIGFTFIDLQTIESTAYYSYPPIEKVYPFYLIVYGIIVPVVITGLVNLILLNQKLSLEPLRLLQKEHKSSDVFKINVDRFTYINKYRIRQLSREFRGNVVLFFGIFISVILMVFSFTIYGSITNMAIDTAKDVKFDYMYTLKYPLLDVGEGERGFVKGLKTYFSIADSDLDITLQGIVRDSEYFQFDVEDSEKDGIYISTSAKEKFGWEEDQEIVLFDEVNDENFSFVVKGIVPYSNGLYVFMDIHSMCELFQKEDSFYNAVFTNDKLDIDNQYIYSITTRDEIKEMGLIFLQMMKGLIVSILLASIVLFIIVIYLLLKMMIDRAEVSISLLKIFGYQNKEVSTIYIGSQFYTVLLSGIISIPLGKLIVDKIYPYMVSNVAAGVDTTLSPVIYIIIMLIIMISYIMITQMLKFRLNNISYVGVLKDRE